MTFRLKGLVVLKTPLVDTIYVEAPGRSVEAEVSRHFSSGPNSAGLACRHWLHLVRQYRLD